MFLGDPWFSRKLSGQVGPLQNQPLTAIQAVGGFLFAQQFAQHLERYSLLIINELIRFFRIPMFSSFTFSYQNVN